MPESDRDWRAMLRRERTQLGLTQQEVGLAAGLSAETIRKYESGVRTPTRTHLLEVLRVLRVPQLRVRALLTAAGFAPSEIPLPSDTQPRYWYSVADAVAEMDRAPWPQFLSGSVMDVVAANRAASLLWGVDFALEQARRSSPQMQVIPAMAEPWFADRIVNFDECLAMVVGLLKGIPDGATALDRPSPWAERILAALTSVNPAAVASLLDAWERVPVRPLRPRWSYRIVWREPEGEIRFTGLVGLANEPVGLSFNDWIPEDAESHRVLERVLGARAAAHGGAPDGRAHLRRSRGSRGGPAGR